MFSSSFLGLPNHPLLETTRTPKQGPVFFLVPNRRCLGVSGDPPSLPAPPKTLQIDSPFFSTILLFENRSLFPRSDGFPERFGCLERMEMEGARLVSFGVHDFPCLTPHKNDNAPCERMEMEVSPPPHPTSPPPPQTPAAQKTGAADFALQVGRGRGARISGSQPQARRQALAAAKAPRAKFWRNTSRVARVGA